jgi:predicted ATPase
VEAARRLGPGFADGVRFVELASVSSADLVAAAVATGLGLTTTAGKLFIDLQSYLRARRLLLVLDNLEQLGRGIMPQLLQRTGNPHHGRVAAMVVGHGVGVPRM